MAGSSDNFELAGALRLPRCARQPPHSGATGNGGPVPPWRPGDRARPRPGGRRLGPQSRRLPNRQPDSDRPRRGRPRAWQLICAAQSRPREHPLCRDHRAGRGRGWRLDPPHLQKDWVFAVLPGSPSRLFDHARAELVVDGGKRLRAGLGHVTEPTDRLPQASECGTSVDGYYTSESVAAPARVKVFCNALHCQEGGDFAAEFVAS